jgi:hypothetical protein
MHSPNNTTRRVRGNEDEKGAPPVTGGGIPSYRSPKKARKQVDEWSVMTLYNDVSFLEEQKMMKLKIAESKAKTRQMLQVCVCVVCVCVCVY